MDLNNLQILHNFVMKINLILYFNYKYKQIIYFI